MKVPRVRPGLFLKGVCMGAADVIPGVSGGTMALILGIYEELVDTLGSLHLRWVRPFLGWVGSGFRKDRARRFGRELRSMNASFLIWLGTGIVVAMAAGSAVIPPLMANYPVGVRAFFLGLILASVGVPFRMIQSGSPEWFRVLAGLLPALAMGYMVTGPGLPRLVQPDWAALRSRGETLGNLLSRSPSALSAERVYWADRNRSLRQFVRRSHPETARELEDFRRTRSVDGSGPSTEVLKARSEPYEALHLKRGRTVYVPRLPLPYVFLAAVVAISAMILPGISGSYILLILGSYFFVLNALRAVLSGLFTAVLPVHPVLVLAVFAVGAGLGLVGFSRLVGWCLDRWTDLTVGVLVGLMVGCLRGVWPFRGRVDGVLVNVFPEQFGPRVQVAVLTLMLGFLLVGVLSRLGRASANE